MISLILGLFSIGVSDPRGCRIKQTAYLGQGKRCLLIEMPGGAFWESDLLQQRSILCAFQQPPQHGGSLVPAFTFWAGSESQNKPKASLGAGSLLISPCDSAALRTGGRLLEDDS